MSLQFMVAVERHYGVWHLWLPGNDATLCGDRTAERREENAVSHGLAWINCPECLSMHRFITSGTPRQTRG